MGGFLLATARQSTAKWVESGVVFGAKKTRRLSLQTLDEWRDDSLYFSNRINVISDGLTDARFGFGGVVVYYRPTAKR